MYMAELVPKKRDTSTDGNRRSLEPYAKQDLLPSHGCTRDIDNLIFFIHFSIEEHLAYIQSLTPVKQKKYLEEYLFT